MKKYFNMPLETFYKFKAAHKVGLQVYCHLLALVTEEVEIVPPHKTNCGLEVDRAGVVLGGGVNTDVDLARRCDNYPKNSFRFGRDVLKEMGLLVLSRTRAGHRLALLGSHKYPRSKAISPRFAWVNRALGRPEIETGSQSQEFQIERGAQSERNGSQSGGNGSQSLPDPTLRSQQVTDPKSELKSENKSCSGDESDSSLLRALRTVWEYYLAAVEQSPKVCTLTPRREKVGLDRLQELIARGVTLENASKVMQLAIDNITASDWHAGRDPKTNGVKYLDWEKQLFGTTEKMEKWLERSGPIQPKQSMPLGIGHATSGSIQ
jgi:hypothetical protein